MPRKLTTEEFIEKAREVHGDRYGYEKVVYEGSQKKVEIICNKHGSFWQSPNTHLQGQGCKLCGVCRRADKRRNTTEEFIKKAKEVHGDKYDYSKTCYEGDKKKVEIVCKEHGSFYQIPWNHIGQGQGCRECGIEKNKEGRVSNTQEFIKKAKEVHGDKYTYNNVVYTKNYDVVNITCPVHGAFEQRPNHHLRGIGCPRCGILKRNNLLRNTTEEFIKKAKEVHGGYYQYHKVDYKSAHTKITVYCPQHGYFEQKPCNHLLGQGCPKCSLLSRGWGSDGFYGTLEQSNLYILNINNQFIKVGLAKNIASRMTTINKDSGYSVEKLYSVSGPAYKLWLLEQTILRLSDLEQYTPEVSFAGQSECVELEELDKVMGIVKEWEKFNKED